jgi:hypothetical protein
LSKDITIEMTSEDRNENTGNTLDVSSTFDIDGK